MSLASKLSAPFRFVENEFESIVNNLYVIYNKKFERSNYFLANFYADGATAYLIGTYILPQGVTFETAALSIAQSYVLWFLHRENNRAGELEKSLLGNTEGVRNQIVEEWKWEMKQMGRFFLIFGIDSILDKVTGYSLLHIGGQSGIELYDIFGVAYSILFALSGYTAAIDTNNPKKSRIVSFAKSLLPQKVPELVPLPKKVNY